MRSRRVVLASDATAARQARKFLDEARCDDHSAEVLHDAKVLVSELVTNAFRHGVPPIELAVACVGERGLEVRVRDAGTASDLQLREASPDDVSGRGLRLVDVLSDGWGVASGPAGKEVWFRVLDRGDE